MVGVLLVPGSALAATSDWPQYLHGPQHSSVSLASAFTVTNSAQTHQVWHFMPGAVAGKPAPKLDASPTVVGGKLFIGSEAGVFYALNASTGRLVWKRSLDTQAHLTCSASGISATAAVVKDPVSGSLAVYAAGARDLYALNASTGALVWKTMIGPPDPAGQDASYNWSSPTVVGGHIYMGLSSRCDTPLVQGGVVEVDQHTGTVLNTWHSVPTGSIGGSVWSSIAVSADGQNVWASTGNECDPTINTCPSGDQLGDSNSIVHLSGSLTKLEAWQAPGTIGSGQDSDFGSSPTLFGAGTTPPSIGACNKNGTYDALAANPLSSSPIWSDTLGAPAGALSMCIASAVWNGMTGGLYLSGDATTINATHYGGSIRRANPTTGAYLWQTGLPCAVMGTPSLDNTGVLAVVTYTGCTSGTTPALYLLNASNGTILRTISLGGSRIFGQTVYAGNDLYVASETKGLYAFAP
jgi:outer membrane protein assembly factor BamB